MGAERAVRPGPAQPPAAAHSGGRNLGPPRRQSLPAGRPGQQGLSGAAGGGSCRGWQWQQREGSCRRRQRRAPQALWEGGMALRGMEGTHQVVTCSRGGAYRATWLSEGGTGQDHPGHGAPTTATLPSSGPAGSAACFRGSRTRKHVPDQDGGQDWSVGTSCHPAGGWSHRREGRPRQRPLRQT